MYEKEIVANFRAWQKGQPFAPILVEIKPTNRCNLSCISCRAMGNPNFRPETEIAPEHFMRLAEGLAKTGAKRVHITGGGEPLAYPGIAQVLEKIMESGMKGSMTTNGTLLGNVLELMVEGGWGHLFISLDSPDAGTHDHLRGVPGTFDRVIANLRRLKSLKETDNRQYPTLELGMVLSSANIGQIEDYLELGHELGARNVTLQPLRVKDAEAGKELVIPDSAKEGFLKKVETYRSIAEKHDLITNFDFFDELFIRETGNIKKVIEHYSGERKDDAAIPCFHPWFFFSVQPDGNVYPCSFTTDAPFGNIARDTAEKIWNAGLYEETRKMFSRKILPEFCNMCCGTNIMITKDVQEEMSRQES